MKSFVDPVENQSKRRLKFVLNVGFGMKKLLLVHLVRNKLVGLPISMTHPNMIQLSLNLGGMEFSEGVFFG
jgi:hypothetical protein